MKEVIQLLQREEKTEEAALPCDPPATENTVVDHTAVVTPSLAASTQELVECQSHPISGHTDW